MSQQPAADSPMPKGYAGRELGKLAAARMTAARLQAAGIEVKALVLPPHIFEGAAEAYGYRVGRADRARCAGLTAPVARNIGTASAGGRCRRSRPACDQIADQCERRTSWQHHEDFAAQPQG